MIKLGRAVTSRVLAAAGVIAAVTTTVVVAIVAIRGAITTRNGRLLARVRVGPGDQTVITLARILKRAGAVRVSYLRGGAR